jgi:N-acetylglutamate synthase-like GNAT family acetyltransferase
MTFSIFQAQLSDAKNIYKIMEVCTKWLSRKNLNHWVGVYSLEKIKNNINQNTVYLIKENEKIAGVVTLIKEKPFYFKCWKDLKAEGFSVVGLAVDPKYMKKGCATKLIEYAENKAKQEKIKYIRFHANSHDEDLTEFYKNRGYEIVGTKKVMNRYEYHFFEKCI